MKKVQIWPIIKGAFVDIYDNLGWVLFVSAIWFAFAVPFLFAILPGELSIILRILLGALVIFLGPATAGAYYLANKLIKRESIEWRDFFFAFKKYFWRAEALMMIFILAIVVIIIDFTFYSQIQNTIVKVLSIFWLYILIFLGVMQTYMFPLLIEQDTGIKKVIVRSFLLSIDNIGVSLVIFLIVTGLSVVCIITGVGALLLLMGVKSFFDTRTFLNVMEKYEGVPVPQKDKEG
ncbi:MAG TPA: DUF624 domain-containing protein [bacterium]|nr:DUF624 domain-containing protein [bacterium]